MDRLAKALLAEARHIRERAYAPYSHFPVGAALASSSGRIFSGCNVENASFGLTICAERNAVFQMVAAGEKEISAILVVGNCDVPFYPCGACRQVLAEFSRPKTRVIVCDRNGRSKEVAFKDLFPKVFSLL